MDLHVADTFISTYFISFVCGRNTNHKNEHFCTGFSSPHYQNQLTISKHPRTNEIMATVTFNRYVVRHCPLLGGTIFLNAIKTSPDARLDAEATLHCCRSREVPTWESYCKKTWYSDKESHGERSSPRAMSDSINITSHYGGVRKGAMVLVKLRFTWMCLQGCSLKLLEAKGVTISSYG